MSLSNERLQGGSDEEILEWCFERGRRPSEEEIRSGMRFCENVAGEMKQAQTAGGQKRSGWEIATTFRPGWTFTTLRKEERRWRGPPAKREPRLPFYSAYRSPCSADLICPKGGRGFQIPATCVRNILNVPRLNHA